MMSKDLNQLCPLILTNMTCQHPVCLVSILAYMRYFFKS